MRSLWLLLLIEALVCVYTHGQVKLFASDQSKVFTSPSPLSSTSSPDLSTSTFTSTTSAPGLSKERSRPECDGVKCTWNLWSHYDARGCTPEYTNGSCCPTHFTCPKPENLNPEKCYLFGKEYNIGDDIPMNGDGDKCWSGCTCFGRRKKRSSINQPLERVEIHRARATIECAQDVGLCWNPKPPSPGCRHHTKLCGGCPDEVCDDSVPHICRWNGKTYEEGQYMSFDGEYACNTCICGKNFTDPTGEGCQHIKCGYSGIRVRSGCVELYSDDAGSCCSHKTLCENDLKILSVPNASRGTNGLTCKLGKFTRPVGERLEHEDCRINCTCLTPPEFTCIESQNCLPKISEAEAAQCPYDSSCLNGECRTDCGDLVEIPGWCSGNGCKCCRHERCAKDTGMCRNQCLDDEYEDTWTGYGCGFVNSFKEPTPKCCVKNVQSTTELGPMERN